MLAAAWDWRVPCGQRRREFSDVLAAARKAAVGLNPTGGVGGGTGKASAPQTPGLPPVACRAAAFFPLLLPRSCREAWIGTGHGCTPRRRARPPGLPIPPPPRSAAAGTARCRAGRAPSTLRRPEAPRSLERNALSL